MFGYTQRTTVGASTTATVSTANKIAIMLFDGTVGQRVCINVTSSAVSGHAIVYNPDGSILLPSTAYPSTVLLDQMKFPASGTYSLLLDPDGTQTGSTTFTVIDTPDIATTLAAGVQQTLNPAS